MKESLKTVLEQKGVVLDWHRLGLLTGLSPESSKEYYSELCEKIRTCFGGNNCPQFATENVNFGLVEALMDLGEWDALEGYLIEPMSRLEKSGAEAIAVCSNTIHRVLDHACNVINVPIIHIGDCVAAKIAELGLERVGFLGTNTTMSEDFMLKHLAKSGAQILPPPKQYRRQIDQIIFTELCKGVVMNSSRHFLLETIACMVDLYDIQGVVLGCTELPLSICREHQLDYISSYKEKHGREFYFFDSEQIHVAALAEFCHSGKLPVSV